MSVQPAHRIIEFTEAGRRFIYFNYSAIKSNSDLSEVVALGKEIISKYAEHSVYAITNITHIAFDTETKEILADWMAFNRRHIAHSAIIGADGLKRIMFSSALALSGRTNVRMMPSKEDALAWLVTV